jgi:hypothetical protein
MAIVIGPCLVAGIGGYRLTRIKQLTDGDKFIALLTQFRDESLERTHDAMPTAIGVRDDNGTRSDLLLNDSNDAALRLGRSGVAGDHVPLDGGQSMLVDNIQCRRRAGTIWESKELGDAGDLLHFILTGLLGALSGPQFFPKDLILGLRPQNLTIRLFLVELRKMSVTPGVVADLKERIRHQLHGLLGMRQHPLAPRKEGGSYLGRAQNVDQVGIEAADLPG